MVLRNQKRNHNDPAHVIAEIDHTDVPEEQQKDATPYDPENAIAKQGAEHRKAGLSKPFQSADVDLIDRIQKIKWENTENRLTPVRKDLRIGSKQLQDHRRGRHKDDTGHHRKCAQGNDALFHALLHAVHAVCSIVLADKAGKRHTIRKSRIVQKALHSGKDDHPCRRICPEGIDAVLNQKRRNAHEYRLHPGRKPCGYNFRQLLSPA